MRAKDVMTTSVVAVGPKTTIEEIAQALLERRISAVPVVDASGAVVGIVSEGDLMRRPESDTERHSSWWLSVIASPAEKAAAYVKSHGRVASDVMTKEVVTVAEDSSLEEIAELLEERRIKRVPVLREGQLVGVVSRANLLHGLVAARVGVETPGTADETIRSEIRSVLRRDAGVSSKFIDITVLEGVVHLWGSVASQNEKKAARMAAESVSGVMSVHDHLGIVPLVAPLDLGAG